MFGSKCILCSSVEVVVYSNTDYLCPKCIEIKRIIDVYSIDEINKAIKFIFVRHDDAILHRTKMILRSNDKVEKKV